MISLPELGFTEESAWRELEELQETSSFLREREGSGGRDEDPRGKEAARETEARKGDIEGKEEKRTIRCPECGEKFDSELELSSHLSLSHGSSEKKKEEEKSLFGRVYERAKEEYEKFVENTGESIKETYSRINSYASGFIDEAKEKLEESYKFKEYFPKVEMEKVSRYELGKGVLGRAFPWDDKIQVLDNLYGWLEDKVVEHEIEHVNNPWKSEFQVRKDTGTLYLGIASGF